MHSLSVFTKYWEPGQVKSRLAKSIGIQSAAQVQCQLFRYLLTKISERLDKVSVVFAPHQHGTEMKQEVVSWQLQLRYDWELQVDGDLGEKLAYHVAQHFSLSREPLVIIGSDCPTIDKNVLDQAWASLKLFDLVLGPSTDGGYYLIGLNAPYTQLFENIRWSSEHVLAQTIATGKKSGLSMDLLEPMTDIDHLCDLEQFLNQIKSTQSSQEYQLARTLESLLEKPNEKT